ncbi:hypothetical protein [Deinococcus humi]|uniref:Transposase n=1 Tax=Deinococcus humi TaxID=662880 RepID=A0A7W8NDU0_9DEIO|nr:hypothetical protein [Deinococcus humi]MBB5363569.1 hypothetical protein [Deinococcus humi]GGO30216.1 hypothetical protein GCM10008949_24770 [Deinococcus humi]
MNLTTLKARGLQAALVIGRRQHPCPVRALLRLLRAALQQLLAPVVRAQR